jgi:hypothetical protein
VLSSYYNNGTSTLAEVGSGGDTGAEPLNMTASLNQSSYAGWNFVDTWGMVNGTAFPYLRAQFPEVPRQINGYLLDASGIPLDHMQVVNMALNGQGMKPAYTGDNGYYYLAYPYSLYSDGEMIMLYSAISGKSNNTVVKTADRGLYGYDIMLNDDIHLSDETGFHGISVCHICDIICNHTLFFTHFKKLFLVGRKKFHILLQCSIQTFDTLLSCEHFSLVFPSICIAILHTFLVWAVDALGHI